MSLMISVSCVTRCLQIRQTGLACCMKSPRQPRHRAECPLRWQAPCVSAQGQRGKQVQATANDSVTNRQTEETEKQTACTTRSSPPKAHVPRRLLTYHALAPHQVLRRRRGRPVGIDKLLETLERGRKRDAPRPVWFYHLQMCRYRFHATSHFSSLLDIFYHPASKRYHFLLFYHLHSRPRTFFHQAM